MTGRWLSNRAVLYAIQSALTASPNAFASPCRIPRRATLVPSSTWICNVLPRNPLDTKGYVARLATWMPRPRRPTTRHLALLNSKSRGWTPKRAQQGAWVLMVRGCKPQTKGEKWQPFTAGHRCARDGRRKKDWQSNNIKNTVGFRSRCVELCLNRQQDRKPLIERENAGLA